MAYEERRARDFGITVEQLREQRRRLGQLLTGPYAGCSPGFARMMEGVKEVERIIREYRETEAAVDTAETPA